MECIKFWRSSRGWRFLYNFLMKFVHIFYVALLVCIEWCFFLNNFHLKFVNVFFVAFLACIKLLRSSRGWSQPILLFEQFPLETSSLHCWHVSSYGEVHEDDDKCILFFSNNFYLKLVDIFFVIALLNPSIIFVLGIRRMFRCCFRSYTSFRGNFLFQISYSILFPYSVVV